MMNDNDQLKVIVDENELVIKNMKADSIVRLTRQQMIDAFKLQDQIWNEAIEAAVKKLKKDFVAPEVVIEIIREVKR